MAYAESLERLLAEVNKSVSSVEDDMAEDFIRRLAQARKVFIVGAGRSGLVAKAFAMRLMHLDLDVAVVGETITPPVRLGDLVICISGSGETSSVVNLATKAKKLGANIAAVTSFNDSSLAKMSDTIVIVHGKQRDGAAKDYEVRQLEGDEFFAPMGTLFEISTMLFLDTVIAELACRTGSDEQAMRQHHSNLE